MSVVELYVFGCKDEPGHYVWEPSGRGTVRRPEIPEARQLDIACVGLPDTEGEIAVPLCTPEPGWSFVSWWDRQIDKRPGCHTGILARGVFTAPKLVALGRLHAPWAFRVKLGAWSLPPAAAEQPAPVPNDHPAVWDLVVADMHARDALGRERYKTRPQPHNGRDALRDHYEELLDAAVYARQMLYERDGR